MHNKNLFAVLLGGALLVSSMGVLADDTYSQFIDSIAIFESKIADGGETSPGPDLRIADGGETSPGPDLRIADGGETSPGPDVIFSA